MPSARFRQGFGVVHAQGRELRRLPVHYFFRLPAFRTAFRAIFFALRGALRAAAFFDLPFDFAAAFGLPLAFAGLALAFAGAALAFAGMAGALAIARARLDADFLAGAADGGAVTTSETGATSTGPFMNGRPMSATTADVAAMSSLLSFIIERN